MVTEQTCMREVDKVKDEQKTWQTAKGQGQLQEEEVKMTEPMFMSAKAAATTHYINYKGHKRDPQPDSLRIHM